MPIRLITLCFFIMYHVTANAVWFEASGQAAIENGNTELARQNATQEAIKQALLFAGASVKSVQKMANGLLQDDQFEIRSAGEVNSIELIDEVYSDGYVTVSIRADIFSQTMTCDASDYQKTIVTTWYPIKQRQQAAVGEMYNLGSTLPLKLEQQFKQFASSTQLSAIEPYYYVPNNQPIEQHATMLARKTNSQYVLTGEIVDMSVSQQQSSSWAFWQSMQSQRAFGFDAKLYDGQTGALVWQHLYNQSAIWPFELHQTVDVNSQVLWQSQYGSAIENVFQDIAQSIDEELACLPAYGRILQVQNEQLSVNIGTNQGVKTGDQLTLYQINQFFDPQGQMYAQYTIHPTKVSVVAVYPESAIVGAVDGSYLANIQANDFVARR